MMNTARKTKAKVIEAIDKSLSERCTLAKLQRLLLPCPLGAKAKEQARSSAGGGKWQRQQRLWGAFSLPYIILFNPHNNSLKQAQYLCFHLKKKIED